MIVLEKPQSKPVLAVIVPPGQAAKSWSGPPWPVPRACAMVRLRSGRIRSSAGAGTRQEEHGTPADFLVVMDSASLEC
jgi:hypothetical protein